MRTNGKSGQKQREQTDPLLELDHEPHRLSRLRKASFSTSQTVPSLRLPSRLFASIPIFPGLDFLTSIPGRHDDDAAGKSLPHTISAAASIADGCASGRSSPCVAS